MLSGQSICLAHFELVLGKYAAYFSLGLFLSFEFCRCQCVIHFLMYLHQFVREFHSQCKCKSIKDDVSFHVIFDRMRFIIQTTYFELNPDENNISPLTRLKHVIPSEHMRHQSYANFQVPPSGYD